MIKQKNNITDEEFETMLIPFYKNYSNYLISFVIPDVIAFYLANAYSRNFLGNRSLYSHIASAIDVFNINYNINDLIPQIKKILKIKYNLEIINKNPIEFKTYEICK